jgi:hypothetical protein
MARPLSYQPLNDFGVNGLNTQDNPATLTQTYLTSADNVVMRESGRISFRKGFKQKVVPSGVSIGSITEHEDQGTNKIFASHGTSIYTIDFTTPNTAFPSSGVDVKHTVANSTGNWQFVNFNDRLHCFHSGVVPQRYSGASPSGEKWSSHVNATAINDGSNVSNSATTMTVDSTAGFPTEGQLLVESEVISYTGITSTTFTGMTRGVGSSSAATHNNDVAVTSYAVPASVTTFDPSCGMGFYGRLWCAGVTESKNVVYYSNLLDGDDWINGDTGTIDLSKVWGSDEIVALAPFFGKLVIFGKNNIAIYNSPETVGSLAIDEVIRGIGCVARDSVQAIGDDLVFLSETGLRSLARTTEKDKLPLTDLSLAIKDRLIRNIGQSTNVKSVYVENEGFYIMTFTDKNITYVFDFKHITELGVPRVTTWTFESDREPSSMVYTKLYSGLLVGQKDGSIAGYEGYFDTDLAWASSAASYTNAPITADVSSIWIRMGENITASLLKKMILVLEGGSGATLGLRWYKDFSVNSSSTTQIDLKPATTGYTSLWGASTSLYGTTSVTTTNAGSFVTGTYYAISSAGNTDFTAIGSDDNDVGTVFQATGAGSGTGAAVSHTHTASLHSASSKYTPIFGLEEYKTPLTGSAKHLKLNMSIVSNGFNTSIQDLAIISKQGKIR